MNTKLHAVTDIHGRQDHPTGANKFCFTRPWSFNSPSAAAAVVLDRNSNGRIEWKIKGARQTYHDWQQARATPRNEPTRGVPIGEMRDHKG